MAAHVYPNEQRFYDEVNTGDRWEPTKLIEGLKVTIANGRFAARPFCTEDIHKINAEIFKREAHQQQLVAEASTIVTDALAA